MKILVTLSENLLTQIDQFTDGEQDRSAFLEAAARSYIIRMRRAEQDARDIEIINANAERLNREAMDVLEYQADI